MCCCKGKRHSQNHECFSDSFIQSARRNRYCAISQCGSNSTVFASHKQKLGKYYARDVHRWEKGECAFHKQVVCSCGGCEEDGEVKCAGKVYHTTNVLSYPLLSLAYEIECEHRAEHSGDIIDPELRQGSL